MPRGGVRPNSGPRRTIHGQLAEAAGILQLASLKLYAIALRDGKLPRRQLYELQAEILREAMAARRRIAKVIGAPPGAGKPRRRRDGKPGAIAYGKPAPVRER